MFAASLEAAVSSKFSESRLRPALGYATRDVIKHYRQLHPEVSEAAAASLEADPDRTKPLFFWQLYSILGEERIVKIVQNLYARIASDDEETWLPLAFTEISGWEHHVATQSAFWLDAMGGGRCYHGGEYRLHVHHLHNACQVMTQVGAARWMHHMRLALDESDLGADPRVRATIDNFLHARMEKYADDFSFETGDKVYGSWNSDDWERAEEWERRGPVLKCPVTGKSGQCEAEAKPVFEELRLQFTFDTVEAVQRAMDDQSDRVLAAALAKGWRESDVKRPREVSAVDAAGLQVSSLEEATYPINATIVLVRKKPTTCDTCAGSGFWCASVCFSCAGSGQL